jgi:hypothetical protein
MKGTAQVVKNPVLVEDLRRMISKVPDNLLGVRDRVLLIGFSGLSGVQSLSPWMLPTPLSIEMAS